MATAPIDPTKLTACLLALAFGGAVLVTSVSSPSRAAGKADPVDYSDKGSAREKTPVFKKTNSERPTNVGRGDVKRQEARKDRRKKKLQIMATDKGRT